MSRRMPFTQAEIARAAKVAVEAGVSVTLEGVYIDHPRDLASKLTILRQIAEKG